GERAHARALDADAGGDLRDIHRRVGTVIFFESSGGQRDRIAHVTELRFALGEPAVETTNIDTAAIELEARSFFVRKAGDGNRGAISATEWKHGWPGNACRKISTKERWAPRSSRRSGRRSSAVCEMRRTPLATKCGRAIDSSSSPIAENLTASALLIWAPATP